MIESLDFFLFSDPNVRYVTLGTMILGASAAIIGCFSFLRKRALVGDAVAHSILPGICLAFIISGNKNPLVLLLGAIISGWLSLLIIDGISRTTKLKNDAAIGIVLSVFFGFGILLLTAIQHSGNPNQAGLDKYLFGKAASLTPEDIKLFIIVGILIIAIVLLFYKEFKLISFNPDFAKSIGLPVKTLEFLLSTITILAVAVGIQAVGVVLMAALLITPASGARFWTDKLGHLLLIASLFGALSGLLGSYISYISPSMPTGPWVVMSLSIFAIISIWFAPKKGMFAKRKVQLENKKKILLENILKLFYHLGEKEENYFTSYALNVLESHRRVKSSELKKGLLLLKKKNSIRIKDGNYLITKKGLKEAKRVIKLHRLWEMYLTQRLKLQPDHVHNDAEAIEHIITPEIERQLEKELNFPVKDPHHSKIPYTD